MKVEVPQNDERFQKFLDNSQYTKEGILRYEQIFGSGFVSTGGLFGGKDEQLLVIFYSPLSYLLIL